MNHITADPWVTMARDDSPEELAAERAYWQHQDMREEVAAHTVRVGLAEAMAEARTHADFAAVGRLFDAVTGANRRCQAALLEFEAQFPDAVDYAGLEA
jgi:hypothetical protein